MIMMSKVPQVTVIIPVYNCEAYLQRCLDSIYRQTVSDVEIITINDGSTDQSLRILQDNAKEHKNLIVIDQENKGQGYARNRALNQARGEYVLFVDADDFIEPLTLELSLARITEDGSDFAHFDWKYSTLGTDDLYSYYYLNKEPYDHKWLLKGGECDELLQMTHFFSVNNLYRKSFLDKHNIRYGENRVYEDNIFVTLTVNRAEKISLIHSPLYIIQRNMSSSTRKKAKDDTHYKSFIQAVKDSLSVFNPRTEYSNYYLIKYFQTKFVFYYIKRIPRKYKRAYLKEYVDAIGDRQITIPDRGQSDRIMRLCLQYNVFSEKKYMLFAAIIGVKTQVLVRRDRATNRTKKLKQRLRLTLQPTYYENQLKRSIDDKSILFLGFDYRYTGNSRYLYEELCQDKRFREFNVKFATNDDLVETTHRVAPNSEEFYKLIATSKYLIAESWIPSWITKRPGMTWFQLWHGTPLKRMLFDSNEPEVIQKNKDHKINKYKDIQNWDYLISDSQIATEKFASAFLHPKTKIIQSGYPRVKYLISNIKNEEIKNSIKQKIGLKGKNLKKKLVLYAPTWRDYNYKKPAEKQDYDYVLDIDKLSSKLGDEYIIMYRDHHFMSKIPNNSGAQQLDVSGYETQELLLIVDHLVTDYSSILFDALAIDLPVSLYATDYEEYSRSRGVYKEIWTDLCALSQPSVDKLAAAIQTPGSPAIKKIDRYVYREDVSLLDKLHEIAISR